MTYDAGASRKTFGKREETGNKGSSALKKKKEAKKNEQRAESLHKKWGRKEVPPMSWEKLIRKGKR